MFRMGNQLARLSSLEALQLPPPQRTVLSFPGIAWTNSSSIPPVFDPSCSFHLFVVRDTVKVAALLLDEVVQKVRPFELRTRTIRKIQVRTSPLLWKDFYYGLSPEPDFFAAPA